MIRGWCYIRYTCAILDRLAYINICAYDIFRAPPKGNCYSSTCLERLLLQQKNVVLQHT